LCEGEVGWYQHCTIQACAGIVRWYQRPYQAGMKILQRTQRQDHRWYTGEVGAIDYQGKLIHNWVIIGFQQMVHWQMWVYRIRFLGSAILLSTVQYNLPAHLLHWKIVRWK
jgi:hypothetical protein